MCKPFRFKYFFFNDTATTEIYTLSLHDALPILPLVRGASRHQRLVEPHLEPVVGPDQPVELGILLAERRGVVLPLHQLHVLGDRKSTRLNSSHANISYAVFCLKKKKYIFSSFLL